MRGIPHAVLVDASGTVVWRGHPASLQAATIEKATTGALATPVWKWSGNAKSVRAALEKRQLAKALEAAQALGEADGGPAIVASIQGMIESKVAAIETARKEGDFKRARDLAAAAEKDLAGLPQAETASAALAAIEKDADAVRTIKGQEKLESLDGEIAEILAKGLQNKKDVQALREKLEKIQKEYAGTFVEKQATERIKSLMRK